MVPLIQPPAIHRPADIVQVQGLILVPPSAGRSGAYLVDPPSGLALGWPGARTPVDMPGDLDQGPASDTPAPPPRRVSKPSWVLVIPGAQAGEKATWSPSDPWSSQWTAPVRVGGMRMVAVMGDADDHDRLTPPMLADPDSPRTATAAIALARKYGAPAVAVVLQRGADAEVHLWRVPGTEAAIASSGPSKAEALDALASLVSSGGDISPTPASASKDAGADSSSEPERGWPVDVENHPEDNVGGRMGFAVVMDSTDKVKVDGLRRAVAAVPGLIVTKSTPDQDGIEVRGTWEGDMDTLVHALEVAGIQVAQ